MQLYEYDGQFVPLTQEMADRRFKESITYLSDKLKEEGISFECSIRPDYTFCDFSLYENETKTIVLVSGGIMHELEGRKLGECYRFGRIDVDIFRYFCQLVGEWKKEKEDIEVKRSLWEENSRKKR